MDGGKITYDEFMNMDEGQKGDAYKDLSDEDKFKVRISMDSGAWSPFCNVCKHRHTDCFTCEAFPEGIPDELERRDALHDKPYPGDNGIRFELIDRPTDKSKLEYYERLKRQLEMCRAMPIKVYDIVKLKDGRIGRVLQVYRNNACEVYFGDRNRKAETIKMGEAETIKPEDIAEVIE